MARGEKHGNREAKKPKQEKTKATATLSPFATPPGQNGFGRRPGSKEVKLRLALCVALIALAPMASAQAASPAKALPEVAPAATDTANKGEWTAADYKAFATGTRRASAPGTAR